MSYTTPSQMREAAEAAITPLGKKRRRMLADLAALDDELWPLVVRAVDVEVPQRRIQSITGLSPVTIRKWTKR